MIAVVSTALGIRAGGAHGLACGCRLWLVFSVGVGVEEQHDTQVESCARGRGSSVRGQHQIITDGSNQKYFMILNSIIHHMLHS